jgi:hypothetical protein
MANVQYMLMDFMANSQGQIVNQTRTVTGVMSAIPTTGLYLNLQQLTACLPPRPDIRAGRSAFQACSGWRLNWSPSWPRSKSKVHRGSSMTPSSDTNSVTTILVIAPFPSSLWSRPGAVSHPSYERWPTRSTGYRLAITIPCR